MSSPLDTMSLQSDNLVVGMKVCIFEFAEGTGPTNIDWISMSSYEITELTEDSFSGKLIVGSSTNTFPFKDFGLEPISGDTWSTQFCVVPYEYAVSENHTWWAKHRDETGVPPVFETRGNRIAASDVHHPKARA